MFRFRFLVLLVSCAFYLRASAFTFSLEQERTIKQMGFNPSDLAPFMEQGEASYSQICKLTENPSMCLEGVYTYLFQNANMAKNGRKSRCSVDQKCTRQEIKHGFERKISLTNPLNKFGNHLTKREDATTGNLAFSSLIALSLVALNGLICLNVKPATGAVFPEPGATVFSVYELLTKFSLGFLFGTTVALCCIKAWHLRCARNRENMQLSENQENLQATGNQAV
jgi:hypothetical protein